METVIILVSVLVPLGISAAVIFVIWKRVVAPLLGQQGEQKRLLSIGVQSAARVLHVEQTGMTLEMGGMQSHRLRLMLQVMPAGMPPYQAETVAMVSILAFSRVQPGCIVTVRYDPRDPRQVAMEAAYPPGQGPGQAIQGFTPPAGGAMGYPQGAHPGQAPGYGSVQAPVPGGYGYPTQGGYPGRSNS